MIVTPNTKSITEYVLTLSEADASLAMADPYSFGDHLAEELRAAGVTAPATNGNGKAPHKPGRDHPLGFRAQTGKARAAKAAKVARPKVKGIECPRCGKTLKTQGFLDRHLRQKHGATSTASQAVAPAAA